MKMGYCQRCELLVNTKAKTHLFVKTSYRGKRMFLFYTRTRHCDNCNSYIYDYNFDSSIRLRLEKKYMKKYRKV